MLRHQDTITQSRKEEHFEECLGIPQEGCRDFSSCVSRWEGEEAGQAVRLMQKTKSHPAAAKKCLEGQRGGAWDSNLLHKSWARLGLLF